MKDFAKKIPWGKVVGIGIAIVGGIGAVMDAVNGDKDGEKIKSLEKRLSELESNIQK